MFDAEFKYDERDGRFNFVENNARPWWQIDFAESCGVPVCRMAYLDALGYDVEPVREYKAGVYGVYLSQDFLAYRELKKNGEASLWRWVMSWIGAHDLIFSWSDPGPTFANLLRLRERLAVHREKEREGRIPKEEQAATSQPGQGQLKGLYQARRDDVGRPSGTRQGSESTPLQSAP